MALMQFPVKAAGAAAAASPNIVSAERGNSTMALANVRNTIAPVTAVQSPAVAPGHAILTPMFGAVGYSLLYLLLGGGFGGAVLIFFIAKMLGK